MSLDSRDPLLLRQALRDAVQQEFLRLKTAHSGRLQKAAHALGLKRQHVQQYAAGTTVPADALLMVLLNMEATLRVENTFVNNQPDAGDARWWEFSMSARSSRLRVPAARPVQMSLFDVVSDLQGINIDRNIAKKGPAQL